ncbi:hypothetical protein PRZ48_014659 [Zasmidium cellare]|uniref:Phosphomevalonate kinase n=1 Tax=Zasmidium cellare TaxID=395010 RepID=A0ABR0DZD5_ZASCE|nr:hypothetical protein PRZ48_014659 [Zasmidium cellare]
MGHNGPVAVSAPGKVLLAGGYLALDRKYTGLVFGLDARIHVLIQDIPTSNGIVLNEITVNSPQFLDAVWEYGYRLAERDGGIEVTQLRADADLNLNRNPFIETTLSYVLSYVTSLAGPNITPAAITILADNDYYSTPADISNGASSKRRFHNFAVPLTKAPKTGLGSSAALVTAVTAALLTYYLPKSKFDLVTSTSKRRLHNLAQAAHCAAQGKVGSGFDVASAVYGTCLYRRFSPTLLTSHAEPGVPKFASEIQDIVEENHHGLRWDTEIHKDAVKIPKGLRLVMCDVSCGSKTPGMVKKVLSWRQEKPEEANAIWDDLHSANEALAAEFKNAAEGGSEKGYTKLSECFTRIRKLIRLMSEKSDVPIEPPAQTELLDACEKQPGVIGGVVPGAGGYDAISLLIEDNPETVAGLEKLLSGWNFKGDGESSESGGKVSMLGVREEMEGVKAEDAKTYLQWLKEF